MDIKILLDNKKRQSIIQSLIKKFSINLIIDPQTSHLSPGNLIKFNYIYDENKILQDRAFFQLKTRGFNEIFESSTKS